MISRICEHITKHRWRKLEGWTVHDERCDPDCQTEYYYRCRICRKRFWSHTKPKNET